MSSSGSVSIWIAELKTGLARKKLGEVVVRRTDGGDAEPATEADGAGP